MSGKLPFLAALAVALSTAVFVEAQSSMAYESEEVERSPSETSEEPVTAILPSSGLSNWVTYQRNLCCATAPVGGPSLMETEFFLRAGPSIPIGNERMSRVLGVGWTLEGGGRFMFFDPSRRGAWFLEPSIVNSYNRGDRLDIVFPLRRSVAVVVGNQVLSADEFAIVPAAVAVLNRTFVGLGVGRELYLRGSAGAPNQWRVGVDGGGRYGTCKADFFYFTDRIIRSPHRTDVIAGAYAAIHSDFEFPKGCCAYFGGVRGEWAYTWSDILQRQSDMMEVNLLLNIGVRY